MSASPPRCPDEGTLLLHFDGTLGSEEAAEVREHLAGCPGCRERFEELRRASLEVAEWIARHDPEPPGREAYDLAPRQGARRPGAEPGVRWRRWAAAAAIVVAVGSLVTPVRALLLEHVIGGVAAWFHDGDGDGVPGAEGDVADGPAGDTASPATAFLPAGPTVTLRFASPGTRGEVTLVSASDSLVTVWHVGADVPLTVRGDVVDLDNRAAPVGGWRVALPRAVTGVRFVVAGGEERTVEVGGLRAPREVRLGGVSPSGGSSP